MISRYALSQFRPSTLAAMMADLLEMPVANAEAITMILEQLKATCGDDGATEFLIQEGVYAGRGAAEWQATE